MKRGGPDHPKTFALAEALGIKRVHAVGLLEMLFHFTSQYAPQGDIGRYSMKRIAAAVDWSGSPVKLIAALVETGWVDTHSEVKLVVHDWSDHADRTTLQRLGRHGKIPIKQNHTVTDEVCAQVDTKTRTPPSLSLSLSLSHSHKPVPLPVPPTAEATPAAAALDPPEKTLERETAAAVSRMQDRHPYPSNGFDALYAFQRLVQTAVNPQAVLVSSEKNHAAWCEDWARQTAESGRTPWVPKLADFFRDGYHAKLPPVRDGPAKTASKSKQERESDAAREQFAKLSKEKANEPRIHGNR